MIKLEAELVKTCSWSMDETSVLGKRETLGEETHSEITRAAKVTKREEIVFPKPHGRQIPPKDPFERDEFISISSTFRSKKNWTQKIFNEDILANWKEELEDQEFGWMWKRLISELQYLASLKTPQAEPSAVDRVWIADNQIPKDLHDEFIKLVKDLLESNPNKDYHPGSNETVVDLVHPSLFCYVKGFSRVSSDRNYSHLNSAEEWGKFLGSVTEAIAEAVPTSNPEAEDEDDEEDDVDEPDLEKRKFLGYNYLPGRDEEESDGNYFSVDFNHWYDKKSLDKYQWIPCDLMISAEGQVKILSYINGLHPIQHQALYPVIGKLIEHFIPLWNEVLTDVLTEPFFDNNRLLEQNRSKYEFDEGSGICADSISEYLEENPSEADVVLAEFQPPSRTFYKLNGKQIQVIVKIASIELTPEKPEYTGSWHIEGAPGENIVATGIYYFAQENIKETHLEFREALLDPDNVHVQCAMGFGNGTSMNLNLGKVLTPEGRLLAFPNTAQHCVSPVQLQDPTKPGFRKILVFFLVNPTVDIISAASIPPGRTDWIPDGYYSLNNAVQHRAELMDTRKYYVQAQNKRVYERRYSFCEH
jgi:hypothetical protein